MSEVDYLQHSVCTTLGLKLATKMLKLYPALTLLGLLSVTVESNEKKIGCCTFGLHILKFLEISKMCFETENCFQIEGFSES